MAYLSGTDWTLETPKVYVVLGCQRSGTSFLANAIRSQGVYFGTKGWRCETRAFWGINRQIVQATGGSWTGVPSESALLEQGELHRDLIIERIADFNSRSELWGCKDPRMSLTARTWLKYLDRDTYLIAAFRRPEQIASSLVRKGQVANQELGEKHAREYARRIIGAIKEFMGV